MPADGYSEAPRRDVVDPARLIFTLRRRPESEKRRPPMPRDVTAALLPDHAAPFERHTAQLDDPPSDELLVTLVATGVCATDLT